MQRIFISDLHLEAPDEERFLRFGELLECESRRVDEIYILGDLVEMWIGDDDDSDCANALIQTLKQASTNCSVFVMHGNRDFLIGPEFSQQSGAQLISDPHQTNDGILLSHGDALCTDDVDYQNLRQMLRSPEWQQDILAKTLDERKAFGEMLRAQSKSSNANKSSNIMDINPQATATLMQSTQTKVLIHGHTHRPGRHEHDFYQRWVTGAWERCGWLARQSDGLISLECFSLAHRYGI